MRIKGWSTLSTPELWRVWCVEFASQADAEATAVWIANRLVKDMARSTRRRFYEVKEIFLRRYSSSLIEGRIARVERKDCWSCDGDGCERCDGTGIYSERTLYAHYLYIEGTRYSFHSYERPRLLSMVPGEDKETYGGKFTDEEIKALKLPCSALVKMLRYAAFAVWCKGGQGSPSKPIMPFDCHCKEWTDRAPGQHHDLCRLKMSA